MAFTSKEAGMVGRFAMKPLFLTFLIALFLLASVICGQNMPWGARYDAPVFSAVFPIPDDKPVLHETQRAAQLDGSVVETNSYRLIREKGHISFGMAYGDYSKDIRSDPAALDRVLRGMIKGTLPDAETGPIIDATIGNIPARQVAVTAPSVNSYVHMVYIRAGVKNRRFFQAIIRCTSPSVCTITDANRFFDSIEVKP